ncbi:AMIN-like domain-containing (lipo)protein [Sphaerisporangium perillae]|uniref:AMIN-like domain-containing (lipo)protein n=1 Tax=Sphaerisporangium perillae TaxID=2935860 RepID=UPI00200CC20D|nr:hypothetical protein [Sphaerisporangium perillae]
MKRIAVATVLMSLALVAACGTEPAPGSSPTSTPDGPAPSSTGPVPTGSSPAPSASAPPSGTDTTPPSGRPPVTLSPSGVPSTLRPSPGSTDLPPPTSTGQVRVTRTPARPPLVKGARFATHQGYDRVVIDLQGEKTGYTVDWVRKLYEDGSGKLIDIKGGAYLQVMLTPANAHTEDGKPTWTRSRVLRPGLANLRTVVRSGDFEGVVTVALVLRRRAGFRVIEQSDPYRLVIDIAH